MCNSILVSKSIITLHHGTIGISSEGRERGCTVTVNLPLCAHYGREDTRSSEVASLRQTSSNNVRQSHSTSREVNHLSNVAHIVHRLSAEVMPLDFTRSSAAQILPEPSNHVAAFLGLETTVLLVDDAALNRKMLRRLIEDRVTSVAEAVDGSDAVNYIRNCMHDVPDVILMDSVMPNMDGPTATREIRALGYSGIIVGVTGNALAEDIESFIRAGADRVLTKPLRMDDLLDIF